MTLPKISILVPAYNHAAYLPACLNSVLAETYPHKELVIINDGSIDNTHLVITAWIQQHQRHIPIIYLNRENRGLTSTLNQLIQLANGDYLRLLASDDILKTGGLHHLLKHLQQYPNKKAVFADSEVIDSQGNLLCSSMLTLNRARKQNFYTSVGLSKEIICRWAVSGSVILLKKEVFDIIGFYNEQRIIDDWDMYLRLIAQEYLLFSDGVVAQYRIHATNTSITSVTEVRIRNLSHQKRVAQDNLPLFHGKFNRLLQAEQHHLQAKIDFLRKNPFAVMKHMLLYLYYRLRAF